MSSDSGDEKVSLTFRRMMQLLLCVWVNGVSAACVLAVDSDWVWFFLGLFIVSAFVFQRVLFLAAKEDR